MIMAEQKPGKDMKVLASLCSALIRSLSKALIVSLLLALAGFLPPALEASRLQAGGQKSTNADDPSCARIKITASSYQKAKAKSEFLSLTEIVRLTMERYFSKTEQMPTANWLDSLKVSPEYRHRNGVFVTLSKNGKTRACWGSVYPREANLVRETALAALGALNKEYRFKPLARNEIKELRIQVTEVQGLEAVKSTRAINPYADGIFVRAGGKGGVILPGEAVDAYYELVLAKLKAGIKPDEACQIYRIRAKIYD